VGADNGVTRLSGGERERERVRERERERERERGYTVNSQGRRERGGGGGEREEDRFVHCVFCIVLYCLAFDCTVIVRAFNGIVTALHLIVL
jgi:hypothetical protein